jgi:hypothetical protein
MSQFNIRYAFPQILGDWGCIAELDTWQEGVEKE